nr:MAG TPA: hypothetical protein [Caudoviricetes sp.]
MDIHHLENILCYSFNHLHHLFYLIYLRYSK